MKKTKMIGMLIIGAIIGSFVGIKASTLISSSQVIYKDNKTVDIALNDLFDELKIGKDKIAEAITAKGVTTTSDNTLEEMASKINSIENGNHYIRYNDDTKYIQVLDQDGNWQDYTLCNELPIPTSDLLYLNGKEYITWTEDSRYANTYSLVDITTKYGDKMVLTGLGTGSARSGGIAGRYTFDNKFKYLHVMNSAGTIVTLDCSTITGTYYILFNNSGWDNVFRLGVSSYKYNYDQNIPGVVTVKQMDCQSLVVNNTVTITKIWMDNVAD